MTYLANEQEMLAVLEKHIAAEMRGDIDTTRSSELLKRGKLIQERIAHT
jgi:hypothetical protein